MSEETTTASWAGLPNLVRREVVGGGTADGGTVELAVVEAGDRENPTIVLLHGYPDTKDVWAPVAARLVDRFHIVAYDVRGAGGSTRPAAVADYTLDRLTRDFAAVLDAVVPGRRVHLVGHDWGSVQAWEFATRPATAERIVTFTSISGPSLDHLGHLTRKRLRRPTPQGLARLAGQGIRSWYVYALHTPKLPELAWQSALGRAWPRLLARGEQVRVAGHPAPTLGEDAAYGANLYRANIRPRLAHPREDAIATMPVQVIHPRHDRYLGRHVNDDLDRWVPNLTMREIDARHWVPLLRPDMLARWIADFAVPSPARPSGDFDGSLVVVTGAGSGIGRATAFAFAEAGARLVLADRDAESVRRTAELAHTLGAEAHAETVDVSDAAAMAQFAEKTKAVHGVPDVVVNNAGIGMAGPFLDTTVEQWQRVLDVNLWGVIHGCRLFGTQMAERGQGGHIVNVASAAAFQPSKDLPAYSTSKAAVLMLSECLRAELAGRGIGVSVICPGVVATNITRTTDFVGQDEEGQRRLREQTTRLYGRRNYLPERVATAILDAVRKNAAVVPVTPEAHAMRATYRLAPAVLRAFARVDTLRGPRRQREGS